MDDQIQLNILADGIVSDTLNKAVRYLIFKAEEDLEEETFRFRNALHLIQVQGKAELLHELFLTSSVHQLNCSIFCRR